MIDGFLHTVAILLPLLAGGSSEGAGVAGKSVQGRGIHYQVVGDGPETVMFIASMHGDETAGTPLVVQLRRRLMRDSGFLQGMRVVLVPLANPDGHRLGKRFNRRGVDLNRNFPAYNWRKRKRSGKRPVSEPETRALAKLIRRYQPSRIVTIHQPLARIDYDGPADRLAARMASTQPRRTRKRLEVRRLGGRAGSLGSWAGKQLQIAVITLELPRRAHRWSPSTLWRRYGGMLLEALKGRESKTKTAQ